MHRFSFSTLAPLLYLLCVSALIAQPKSNSSVPDSPENQIESGTTSSPKTLEHMVVTDTRTETERDQSGRSVTVIDRKEIRRRDRRSVHELLRTVPGVRVSQSGGPGKSTSVFIRGTNSDHTLVLLNGFRVNSTTTGTFDYSSITTDNIQRIEILRGPHSTLYGSEAIGGVINIITEKGETDISGHARAEAGSYASQFYRLHGQGSTGPYHFSVSASRRTTRGISALDTGRGDDEEDGYRNTTISGRVGRSFLGDGRVDVTFRTVQDRNEIDSRTDDPNAEQERKAVFAGVHVTKPITEEWTQTVKFGYNEDNLDGDDPDTPSNNFNIDKRITTYLWQSEFHPVSWNTITAGVEREEREGANQGSFNRSVTIQSVFLQNRVTLGDRLTVTAGLRNDDHDTAGSEPTYHVSTALRYPETNTRFHAHYGTGFRAPDLNELFFSGAFGAGNPNLEPEESVGFDVGIDQSFLDERLTAGATYYENHVDNLIEFVDQGGFFFVPENVSRAITQGWELSGQAEITETWSVSATYTYTEARNQTDERPLARRPEQKTTLRTSVDLENGLSGTASWVQVHKRFDTSGNRLDDYNLLDLSLRYETPYDFAVTGRVNNLFNEDYNEVPGLTSPGFNGYVGLEYSW